MRLFGAAAGASGVSLFHMNHFRMQDATLARGESLYGGRKDSEMAKRTSEDN